MEIINRDPFDFICDCDHRDGDKACHCMRRKKWNTSGPCADCKAGTHVMKRSTVQAGEAEGRDGER